MFTIGKFSKLSGVNVKTLRWYDEVGILKPDVVDQDSGYRYYSDKSLRRLNDIHFFQAFEFTIQEIIKMDEKTIENKTVFLQKKFDFITANMDLLEKIKGELRMGNKNSVLDLKNNENFNIYGKWAYSHSTTSFVDAINYCSDGIRVKMPRTLIFGLNSAGTTLNDFIKHEREDIFMNDENGNFSRYGYTLRSRAQDMVIFKTSGLSNNDADKAMMFHVYNRLNEHCYTEKEIEKIKEIKATIDLGNYNPNTPLQVREVVGEWVNITDISENEIKQYPNINKEKAATGWSNYISPIFDYLNFDENGKDVRIMHPEMVFRIAGKGDVTQYDKTNTIMRVSGNAILNSITKEAHRFEYKKDGDKEYLFVFKDLAENDAQVRYFVYERLSDENVNLLQLKEK